MRAASTGGGLVRLVVIRLVVLAALVMTAAGASSTSAVAAAAVSVAASATVAATAAVAAAAHEAAAPPPAGNATACPAAAAATYEVVNVSLRQPPCFEQIKEGPGPPYSRCPATRPCRAVAADRSDNNINNTDNDKNNNKNNNNNNNNNYDNNNNNNNSDNSNHHQCLEYARNELIPEMCPDDPAAYLRPAGRLLGYRLRHCCHHTVESVVQRSYDDADSCRRQVEDAIRMDEFAAAMSCQFNEVLARYDCNQTYSAMTCDSCKEAYALWACAAILPHWTYRRGSRYRVHACKSVCLEAEQKCPWLLPVADDTNPYAGEAAFTCIDPDIWYQTTSRDGEKNCCYEHCDGGGLCVRNGSSCDVGGNCLKQRPVRVTHQDLNDDDSPQCPDYNQYDSSASSTAVVLRLLLFAAGWSLVRQRSALAVT